MIYVVLIVLGLLLLPLAVGIGLDPKGFVRSFGKFLGFRREDRDAGV